MAMIYLMQARSTTSGALVTWQSATPDFAGATWPGPGSPEYIAASARPAAGDLNPVNATSGINGIVRLASDLAGNGGSATAPKVAGVTGDASGNALMTSPNGLLRTPNAKIIRRDGLLLTSAAGVAGVPLALWTFATTNSRLYTVRGTVHVQNSPVSAYGKWEIDAVYRNNVTVLTKEYGGGTAGAAVIERVNVASFVVALAISGQNLVLNVTDPVGGRRWVAEIDLIETIF